jgi:hypothetical protein
MQSSHDIYRFSLETVPFEIQEYPESRPVLLLLLNESQGLVAGMELMPHAPTLEQSKEWLLDQLASPRLPGVKSCTPSLLLVEDPSLYQALRFTLRSAKIKVQQDGDRQFVEHILSELYAGMGRGNSPASLLQILGEEDALDWVRAALAYCRKRPWDNLQTLIECHVSGRSQPYGVHVIGSSGNELGLILFASVEQATVTTDEDDFQFLVGFSLSEESILHPQDLEWMQAQPLKRDPKGWPHFIFAEDCNDEDEQVFRWLLGAVPRLAQDPKVPICDKGYELIDPLAAEREPWENFETFAEPHKKKGRLTKSSRVLLHLLHEFLLYQKYERDQEVAPLVRDCQAIARMLLLGRPASDWKERILKGPQLDKKTFQEHISRSGKEWKSVHKTWEELGDHLGAQDLYFGPTIPLLLLAAELSRLRRESGWEERLTGSHEVAISALHGATEDELSSVSQHWKRWLEELSEKYLVDSLLSAEPAQVHSARQAAERFVETIAPRS